MYRNTKTGTIYKSRKLGVNPDYCTVVTLKGSRYVVHTKDTEETTEDQNMAITMRKLTENFAQHRAHNIDCFVAAQITAQGITPENMKDYRLVVRELGKPGESTYALQHKSELGALA